jgi:lysyl-tRNA synthetase class 2
MRKYRQSAIRDHLELRARIIDAIRRFFIAEGYLEVETPVRIPAPAPEANIDAQVSGNWFLQTSPEICMKQLLAAGYNKIFQICKCFRKQERGSKHLPELTMLEWYSSGQNYLELMDQCEQLILFLLTELDFGESLVYQGKKIDLKTPWKRLSVARAFSTYASMTINQAVTSHCFDEILVDQIEPRLGANPIFLYDYPACQAALARLKPGGASFAERFELYIGGMELCNAFSELTDPAEQRLRFEAERNVRNSTGKLVYPLPEKFLEKFLNALADMPDAAGNALGIDRLVMLFADTKTIDDVVAFTPEEL